MTASFQPKVSIIIPVYNGSNYLEQAIESALAQTYPNVEIIVVDDGSDDGGATQAIAQGFGTRIRYIHQENGGCGAALNTGIAAMSGDYFSWLSHDDLYTPQKLSLQIHYLSGLADRSTILYANYRVIDAKGRAVHQMRLEAVGTEAQRNTGLFPLTRGLIHGCTLLIARSLFERHGGFDPALKTTQDYDLWFRLFRQAPVHFQSNTFVLSRSHDEQTTKRLPDAVRQEGERLWARFVSEVTVEEAEALYGSHYRYLMSLARFLPLTPYAAVASVAERQAEEALEQVKVSVVIPFRNRINWTLEAVESARSQTHSALEILLIDDGSDDDVTPLTALAVEDARLRYIRLEPSGAAAARNRGVGEASGRYVAFLDSDDIWLPNKVARQLSRMEELNLAVSHTSYRRRREGTQNRELVSTAVFSGNIYPRLIASCPIATPTVMARTEVLREHPFPVNLFPGEDVITWINLAEHYEFDGLDDPLTEVRISCMTTSASVAESERGLVNILSAVLAHPRHRLQHPQILSLIDAVRRHEELRDRPASDNLVAETSVAGEEFREGGAIEAAAAGLRLMSVGLDSLRLFGVRVTLLRMRGWLRLRRGTR